MAISVTVDSHRPEDRERAQDLGLVVSENSATGWILRRQPHGMVLDHAENRSRKPLHIDFSSPSLLHRRKYTLGKNQLIAKALGLRYHPHSLFDATAGLGGDAFLFVCFGLQVTAAEENPLVYFLLEDAWLRWRQEDPELAARLTIHFGSSQHLLANELSDHTYDIIYMDPMFSERKKFALSSGPLQWLQELLANSSPKSEEVLTWALQKAQQRVVVKRPLKSSVLHEPVSHSFKGKSVRYDMYLASSSVLGFNQD